MTTKISKREKWVDIAKGIAMMLVIVGHSLKYGSGAQNIIRGIIFSFHMPIFFILSGVTSNSFNNETDLLNNAAKLFKKTVMVAFYIFLVRIIYSVIKNGFNINWIPFLRDRLLAFVFASGVDVNVYGVKIPALGMMWFLVCLFFSRVVYNYVNLKHQKINERIIILLIIFAIGYSISQIQWLPFCLDLSLIVVIYYEAGKLFKSYKSKIGYRIILISFVLWTISFIVSYKFGGDYLELAQRRFPFFPISIMSSIFGSIFICCLSMKLANINYSIMNPIETIGKYSIYLFVIHCFDYFYESIWMISDNLILNIIIRLLIDLILFRIIILLKKYISFKRTNI